jgi:hypothetical protein
VVFRVNVAVTAEVPVTAAVTGTEHVGDSEAELETTQLS